jgi:hypothetical protein
MFVHKHAIRTRPTVELDGRYLRTIYVVETDLAVHADDPEFDQGEFEDLVQTLRDYLATHTSYDSIRIDPIRKR